MTITLVEIAINDKEIPDLEKLLPLETATTKKWKADALLEHLLIKEDGSGVYLIFNDIGESVIKELLITLLLFHFSLRIAYTTESGPKYV